MILSPFEFFQKCFSQAQQAQLPQHDAMVLATSNPDAKPSARMVLLKGVEKGCFRFFTNYESRKSGELLLNPKAQLLFYWPQLGRQIRVEGDVRQVSDAESDQYWSQRPRMSQIGAIASQQSRTLSSMEELRAKVSEVEKTWSGKEIQRPKNWGGFELAPNYFEFWEDRADRLHERITYTKDASNGWKMGRLWP